MARLVLSQQEYCLIKGGEKMDKNVTVLGGGPGGYTAAIRAAQKGAQVTLIEADSVGGTCLNWGCIPTKAYVESVETYQKANKDLTELGLEVSSALGLKSIKKRKDKIVSQLVTGVETLLNHNKVQLIKGKGKVISPREVEVNLNDGTTKLIKNDALILATGSQPVKLPIPGIDLPQVIDSKGLLDLQEIPEHLVIIGGGVIGLEFAQIFAGLGSRVTVVEMLPQILAVLDTELVRRLQPVLKRKGIDFLTKTKVTEITPAPKGVEVHISGKKEDILWADKVLVAAGRQANLDGINPEELGLTMEGKFIKVNTKMVTNLPDVYAIGDIVPSPMLAHVASYEAEIAVKVIFGEKAEANYQAIPSCVYTHPELAGVGLTEDEVKEKGIDYQVGKFPFTANGRALTQGETYGMVKIIAENSNGRVLGAHILGPQASELIHQLTLAIRWNLTVEQVAETIHAHPTLAESILEASHGVFGKPVHFG